MPLEGEYEPSKSHWARKQAETYEATGGEKANTLQGKPIIVLTNVGAKSRKLHKNALMRVEHDGQYAIVGSKGGSREHPRWVFNVRAHPHVELQDGSEKHDFEAREVTGAERDLWWARALEVWPAYAGYQKKTDRLIPVFVLTRIVV